MGTNSNFSKLQIMAAVIGFVVVVTLVLTLTQTNSLLSEGNEQDSEADADANEDRLRAEYQRVLLGCSTAGALESDDPQLRQLCDVELDKIRAQLEEAEDR